MEPTPFIVTVFCVTDICTACKRKCDWLKGQTLRQRGPKPALADREVLTMEVVGEFLGMDTDTGIFHYFRRHYADWSPASRQVSRTSFVRQAAKLWRVKQQLWKELVGLIDHDRAISITDCLPIPVCRFPGRTPGRCVRAYRYHILAGETALGREEVARQSFWGLRVHVHLSLPGVITDFRLAPANVHDWEVAEDLFAEAHGFVLGDRNYGSPPLHVEGKLHSLNW